MVELLRVDEKLGTHFTRESGVDVETRAASRHAHYPGPIDIKTVRATAVQCISEGDRKYFIIRKYDEITESVSGSDG